MLQIKLHKIWKLVTWGSQREKSLPVASNDQESSPPCSKRRGSMPETHQSQGGVTTYTVRIFDKYVIKWLFVECGTHHYIHILICVMTTLLKWLSKVLSGTHFRETNHCELKVHFWKNARKNQYCQIVIQEQSMHFSQNRGSFLDFFKNDVNESIMKH